MQRAAARKRVLWLGTLIAVALTITACTRGQTTGATSVTASTATLNASGFCDATGARTCKYYFRYGVANYNARTATQSIGGGLHVVSAKLTGLVPGKAYQFQACLESTAGSGIFVCGGAGGLGSSASFSTPTTSSPWTVPSPGDGSMPAGLPVADSVCAAQVISAAENRPKNQTANHTMPANNGQNVKWGSDATDYPKFGQYQWLVTGHFTGTTDEILQWAACKWGINPDLLRADAEQESDWNQGSIGDQNHCGSTPNGSWGILQVMDACNGSSVLGGYPDTYTSTALDADYTAYHDRACFDGVFTGYLPSSGTMSQWIAANGQDSGFWGCVGQWFSGGWYDSGAKSYIASVQNYYKSKDWLKTGW
jgi:hypothetical protein